MSSRSFVETVIPLHAEAFSVSKKKIVRTRVCIETKTTTCSETVSYELGRQDVEIERVPNGQIVETVPEPRQEGDVLILPVVEEVLVRRFLIKEEIRITSRRTTSQASEVVELRNQEATITRITTDLKSGDSTDETQQEDLIMATETIVAVFDNPTRAAAAIESLRGAGLPESAIEQHSSERGHASDLVAEDSGRKRGFWAWLMGEGADERHYSLYDRSIASGDIVVTVVTDTVDAEKVISILEEHSPIDLTERQDQYGAAENYTGTYAADALETETRTPTPAASSYTASGETAVPISPSSAYGEIQDKGRVGEEVISLAEEQLEVGKRQVQGGTTRIHRYVVERPIEEQITLRDEHVSVFRRPVNSTATVGADAFTDRAIELTETTEEAVIAKRARVVEEVVINKAVDERVETVRDTVRREEVEIEGPGRQAVPPVEDTRGR